MTTQHTSSFRSTFSEKTISFGCVCICVACFATPLSTSVMGTFSALAVLCWIISGHFLTLPDVLKRYPAASGSLLLFLFMCCAISYSPATLEEAFGILKKYRELLLLPIFLSMLSLFPRYRKFAEYSFLSGCITLMLISYGIKFGLFPAHRYGYSIVFHITHNFFMAVLAFWAVHYFFDSRNDRWIWAAIFIGAVINIFYIAPGRTGMIVFISLLILFMFQRLSMKHCVIAILLFCSSLMAMYYTSENLSGRTGEVIEEIKHYKPGKSRTSIGQRFDWYRTGIMLVKERPIFGHGTGSYPYVQKKITSGSNITQTDNPHNEFLFITIQFGLIGLGLFISLIVLMVLYSRSVDRAKRMLLQGVIVAILTGSLINSLLFDSQQGHFFLFMSATLMAAQESRAIFYRE